VVVGVDAELDESSDDYTNDCEDKIVYQSRALLPAGTEKEQIQSGVEDLDEILSRFGLQTKLVVIGRANSLALCFICTTSAAVVSLRDQWRRRQLRDTVESLFGLLSGVGGLPVKRVTWPLTEYHRCWNSSVVYKVSKPVLILAQ